MEFLKICVIAKDINDCFSIGGIKTGFGQKFILYYLVFFFC